MLADVDAASAIVAGENGALYGTKLIWLLLLLAVPLFVIQEVAGRTGVVTRKGLGQLSREKFGRRRAAFSALPMAVVNILSFSIEYTGIALGLEIFGIPAILSIPVVFALNLLLVYERNYAKVEKVLLVISVVLVAAFAISGYYGVLKGVEFTPFYFVATPTFLFLIATNIGSTIEPFMLFYQPSATAEKEMKKEHLWAMRLETGLGALTSQVIIIIIGIASIGVNPGAVDFVSVTVLASSLSPVAGNYAPVVFGIGLVSAGFLALIVISLGTAWGVTEAMGWNRKNRFRVYLLESAPALIISLLPISLLKLTLGLLALDILALIVPGAMLGLIASDNALMGEYSLKGLNKMIFWTVLFLTVGGGLTSLIVLFWK